MKHLPSPQYSSPVIGRSSERVFLREAFAKATAGAGQVVLIGGEAGIGKTTMVRDLLNEIRRENPILLSSQCFDLTNTPPYGPWLDVFVRSSAIVDAPRIPAPFAGGSLGHISDQAKLYSDVREFLLQISERDTLVVILEDLHWADPASLELLRYLAPRLGSSRILLVLTYRDDEITRNNPFYRQLPQIIRESNGLRIDLRGLNREDIVSLIRATWELDGSSESSLADYLTRHAEGNPFFVVELLRALEDDGVLPVVPEADLSAKLDHLIVPSLLRQVIESRIDRLGMDAKNSLAIASVIGQDVPIALWSTVSETNEPDLLDLIERAVDAHVLEAGRTGTSVTFVHALTRATLYESVFPPRRRAIHGLIANELISSNSSNLDAIAYHLVQASDDRAPDWLIKAGDAAQRSYAWLSAVDRFSEAARILEDVSGSEQTRGWLLYRIARLQRYRRNESVMPAFEDSERLGRQTGDLLLEIDARYSSSVYLCFQGDFDSGIDIMGTSIERMEQELDAEHVSPVDRIPWMADSLPSTAREDLAIDGKGIELLQQAGIHHRRGGLPWFLALSGRLDAAEAMANRFLNITGQSESLGNWVSSAAGHAHQGAAIVQALRANREATIAHFNAGRQLYAKLDHHAVTAFSLMTELRDSAIPFRLRDIQYRTSLGVEAAAALRRSAGTFPEGLSPERAMLSLHYLEGRWDEAERISNDIAHHGTVILRREVVTNMTSIYAAQGKYEAARAMIEQALPLGTATRPGSTMFRESTELMLIAATIALSEHRSAEARSWIERYDEWLDWSGAKLGLAESHLAWASYFRVEQETDTARSRLLSATEIAAMPEQSLVLQSALRSLGELDTEQERFEDASVNLKRALDIATVCQLPFHVARTHIALAELAAALNEDAQALDHLSMASPTIDRLGLNPLASRSAAIEQRLQLPARSSQDGLTPRELEVLKYVALGLTDAAVADELFISPRTVSQHLRSVYSKLGVSSRAQATRYAMERGIG